MNVPFTGEKDLEKDKRERPEKKKKTKSEGRRTKKVKTNMVICGLFEENIIFSFGKIHCV